MLGLLQKRVLGQEHPTLKRLLPFHAQRFGEERGRGHNKPLYGHWLEATYHPSLCARSIFSMVDIYNNLPQNVVDAGSVTDFQHLLKDIARERL